MKKQRNQTRIIRSRRHVREQRNPVRGRDYVDEIREKMNGALDHTDEEIRCALALGVSFEETIDYLEML